MPTDDLRTGKPVEAIVYDVNGRPVGTLEEIYPPYDLGPPKEAAGT